MTYQKKPTGPFSMTEELRSALQIWGRATEGDEDADDVVTEALNRISQPVAAQQHAQVDIVDLMPKRAAFISWVESRSIDASIEKDSWGARIFKHPHVQSMWEGWFNAPTESACTKQHAQAAKAVEVAGLGSITNEDDGVLTLRFKDEDSASNFMLMHLPTVDCRDMPRTNLVEDNSRVTGNAQAAQDRGAEAALSDEQIKDIVWEYQSGGDDGKFSFLTEDLPIMFQAIIDASQQPAAAPDAPILIARIKRYRDAFGCTIKEAKEARDAGRDISADGNNFIVPAAAPAIQVQEWAARDERKPAMSMFASMEDYREALTDYEQNRHEAQERAAFEKAARRITHSDDASFERDGDDYHDYTQSRHWAFWQARAALASPAPVQPAPVADAYQQGRAAGIEEAAGMLDEMSGLMRSSYAQALIPKAAAAIRALAAKPSEAV